MFYLSCALLRVLFLQESLINRMLTGENFCLFIWEMIKFVILMKDTALRNTEGGFLSL